MGNVDQRNDPHRSFEDGVVFGELPKVSDRFREGNAADPAGQDAANEGRSSVVRAT